MTSEIKPDAWLLMDSTIISNYSYNLRKHKEDGDIPLYAKRDWVGLTDLEIAEFVKTMERGNFFVAIYDIEKKLKEKNT